jgi:hypothetical protein
VSIVLLVLACVAVASTASAQNQRAVHYGMTVTLQGGGTGNVYGCSKMPFLGPNPPNSTNPGFTLPPCFNPGAETSCPDAPTPCAWSPAEANTTVTRDISTSSSGSASLLVTGSPTSGGPLCFGLAGFPPCMRAVTDCITELSSGSKTVSFAYRTTSSAITDIYARYVFYSDTGCDPSAVFPDNQQPPILSTGGNPIKNGSWNVVSGSVTAPFLTGAGRIFLTATCGSGGCGGQASVNFDEALMSGVLAAGTIDCPRISSRCNISPPNEGIQNNKDFVLIATPTQGSFTGWDGSTCTPQGECTACSGNGVCILNEPEGTSGRVTETVVANFGTPTLVTVRSLAGTRRANGALVRWRTASDVGILGFNVYRELKTGLRLKLNRSLLAASSTPAGRAYRWLDRAAPRHGKLRYWIQEKLLNGAPQWYGAIVVS